MSTLHAHRHGHPLVLLLLRSATVRHIQSIHAHLALLGLTSLHPSFFLSKLLFALSFLPKLSDHSTTTTTTVSYSISLFHSLPEASTFNHNLLIRLLTRLSLPIPALHLFSRLRSLSLPPDSHTFPLTISAAALLPSPLPLAGSLHSQSLKFGFRADLFVCNTLISIYSASDSVLEARRVFDEMTILDVVTLNAMIDGYLKAGDLGIARDLFDSMPTRDVVSWGTILAGYSKAGQFSHVLELFDQMIASGSKPDDVALVSVLSACAQLGALDRGEAVHDYIDKNRVRLNVYLATGLVDMYAKCGCITIARDLFELSKCRDLYTWNAIVVGVAFHGHGELSLEYFDRMLRTGVRPDGVTFLGVLTACSHVGLIQEARRIFEEMEGVYGVKRELKHYGCMSDLLGRAGLIQVAMEMIEGMPMEGDVYVWGGVLGGCRIHGNVEVAEIAARHLLELNPEDSGIYSIMANIYATARRWEDVARMRRLMNDRKVKKNVGCSSIQVNEINQEFVGQDEFYMETASQ